LQRYGPGVPQGAAGETAPDIALPAGDHDVRVLMGEDSMTPLQVRLTLQTAQRYEIP
jgi:hypothetical protein